LFNALLVRFVVVFLAFTFAVFLFVIPALRGPSNMFVAYALVAGITTFLNYCFWHRIPGPIVGGIAGALMIEVWKRDFLGFLGLTAGATVAALFYQTIHRELGPMELS
jgi:hypothetical protein